MVTVYKSQNVDHEQTISWSPVWGVCSGSWATWLSRCSEDWTTVRQTSDKAGTRGCCTFWLGSNCVWVCSAFMKSHVWQPMFSRVHCTKNIFKHPGPLICLKEDPVYGSQSQNASTVYTEAHIYSASRTRVAGRNGKHHVLITAQFTHPTPSTYWHILSCQVWKTTKSGVQTHTLP